MEEKKTKKELSEFKDENFVTRNIDTPISGMLQDISPNKQPHQSYRFALNAVNETREGENVFLSNESAMNKITIFHETNFISINGDNCVEQTTELYIDPNDIEGSLSIIETFYLPILENITGFECDGQTFENIDALISYIRSELEGGRTKSFAIGTTCCVCDCTIEVIGVQGKYIDGSDVLIEDIIIEDGIITLLRGAYLDDNYDFSITLQFGECCNIHDVSLFYEGDPSSNRDVYTFSNNNILSIIIKKNSIEHNSKVYDRKSWGSGVSFKFWVETNDGICEFEVNTKNINEDIITVVNCCDRNKITVINCCK